MDLTDSYLRVVPEDVLERYDWTETRQAAAVLAATNPEEFDDLMRMLAAFAVDPDLDIFPPGGNESLTAARLNEAFRTLGWREASYKVTMSSSLTLLPWSEASETGPTTVETETDSSSYLVDNVKGSVAIDVEWHAKDGNLDRDIAAYRSLHAETIVDAAAIITMNRKSMRGWARELAPDTTKWATSTTTNLEKIEPRLRRGDGGGCPILVAAICRRTM